MARVTVSPRRNDPYKNFKFRVTWSGRLVAGFGKVSALSRAPRSAGYREGAGSQRARRVPGGAEFEAVTLERGVTHDAEFYEWASSVVGDRPKGRAGRLQRGSRSDINIELLNEAGEPVHAWKLTRCWVSKLCAMPDLDADGNAVVIESLTLEHGGIEDAEPARTDRP